MALAWLESAPYRRPHQAATASVPFDHPMPIVPPDMPRTAIFLLVSMSVDSPYNFLADLLLQFVG